MSKILWGPVHWVSSALAFVGLISLAACSDSTGEKVAGVSTVETENAYVVQVMGEDNVPVVNAKAVLRAANYLPMQNGGLQKVAMTRAEVLSRTDIVYLEYATDAEGILRIDNVLADSMTLEILDGNRGAFVTLLAENIQQNDSTELVVNRLGVMSGKVELPAGEEFAWVQIYGTDRKVKTDAEGYYEIAGLAPADYRLYIVVADTSMEETASVKFATEYSSSSSEKPESSAAISSSFEELPESSSEEVVESSSSEVLGYLDVIDFENGLKSNIVFVGDSSELYLKPTDTTSVVMSPGEYEAELSIVEAGAGREGHAMHWTTSAKTGQWSFMGLWMCSSTDPCDFSVVDSIVYYVRGTGSYSFNLETIIDGATGKAVFLDTLKGTDEWERVVVRPSDFMEGDSTYGNMGWDFVSKQVTNIAVPAYYDTEIWIDDIKFYGVTKEDLP